MKPSLFPILLLLALVGCATVGHDFDEQNVSRIQRGTSNRQELESWFGKPAAVQRYDSGNQELGWIYVKVRPGGVAQKKFLKVIVNPSGVVVDFSYTTKEGTPPTAG